MEKVEKHQDLRHKLGGLWNVKTIVAPVVIGALDIVSENLACHLKTVEVTTKIELLQKEAFLRRARLLRNVLEA